MAHDWDSKHHRDAVLFDRTQDASRVKRRENDDRSTVAEDIHRRAIEAADMRNWRAHTHDIACR